jgi:hypothetical protein
MNIRRGIRVLAQRLAVSGVLLIGPPLLPIEVYAATSSAPPLEGNYKATNGQHHPYVFATQAQFSKLVEDKSIVARKALERLEDVAASDVKNAKIYETPYAGCDLDQYTSKFSYGDHSAVDVATTLASYAYLASLKQGYGKSDLAIQAENTAKIIMLNWATSGFRNSNGFLSSPEDFCSSTPAAERIAPSLVALTIGRALPYWAEAEDLMLALSAFSDHDIAVINAFLDQYQELLVKASNYKAVHETLDCQKFTNQVSASITGLLAIARLRDDRSLFQAAAFGANHILKIPWTLQVQENIYGYDDKQRACGTQKQSAHYYDIGTTAPGEIVDRYRAGRFQTFGYSLGSLTDLLLSGKLISEAGYNSLTYMGSKGQTLLLPLHYYAFYLVHFMSDQEAVIPAGVDYPSARQYAGHPISRAGGVSIDGRDNILNPYLVGHILYPQDADVNAVLDRARIFFSKTVPFYAVNPLLLWTLQ